LSSITASPAAATALAAAAPAHGRRRRQGRSNAAPRAAISGHFTHHAEASRKSRVSGVQRMLSPKVDTAMSIERIPSRMATIAGER
jgi:hypothetical protein